MGGYGVAQQQGAMPAYQAAAGFQAGYGQQTGATAAAGSAGQANFQQQQQQQWQQQGQYGQQQGPVDDDMPHYNAYMAGIICGYLVVIAANLILIYGSMKNNRSFLKRKTLRSFRWLFVPWLFINMILVIACGVGALTLFVWFSFVQPVSQLFNSFSCFSQYCMFDL